MCGKNHENCDKCDRYLQYKISEFNDINALVTGQRQSIVYFLRPQPSLVLTLYLVDTHRNVNHCLRSLLNNFIAVGIRRMIILNIL